MADYLYGINPIHEAFQGGGRKPVELLVVGGERNDRLAELVTQAKQRQLKINIFERRELDRLAGHSRHQGVLLKLTPFNYTDFTTLLQQWDNSGQVA
ncbi:MAG: RNA methyltransferase substrate-binding domain-containing protein, partial [Thermodesulfobacteriota bacterium]|nr:RNA methyltransferase substrate-binding domain-containing protein [Thermodesulfobacteriota bacterium]